jgi:hypothetical protein
MRKQVSYSSFLIIFIVALALISVSFYHDTKARMIRNETTANKAACLKNTETLWESITNQFVLSFSTGD